MSSTSRFRGRHCAPVTYENTSDTTRSSHCALDCHPCSLYCTTAQFPALEMSSALYRVRGVQIWTVEFATVCRDSLGGTMRSSSLIQSWTDCNIPSVVRQNLHRNFL